MNICIYNAQVISHNIRLFSSVDDGGILGTQADVRTVMWFPHFRKSLCKEIRIEIYGPQ
jgi:hypothetical protein